MNKPSITDLAKDLANNKYNEEETLNKLRIFFSQDRSYIYEQGYSNALDNYEAPNHNPNL